MSQEPLAGIRAQRPYQRATVCLSTTSTKSQKPYCSRHQAADMLRRVKRSYRSVTALVAAVFVPLFIIVTSAAAVVITQHPYPSPAPPYERSVLVAEPNGLIVEAQAGGLAFDRVNPQGAFSPGPAGPAASLVTVGPTGAIFYVAQSGASPAPPVVFEITGGGVTPRAKFASAAAAPIGMATTMDGAVWLLDYATSALDRYTPGGELVEYHVGHGPISLAPASGAAVVVAQSWPGISILEANGKTLQGSEFAIPLSDGPRDVIAGPDGGLWFTESTVGRIGRLTPTGQLEEFDVPNPNHVPLGGYGAPSPAHLAVGPDGALWYSDPGDNAIGRITVTGEVSEYRIPALSASQQLKKGIPDAVPNLIASAFGEIWFTESNANALGSLSLSGAETPTKLTEVKAASMAATLRCTSYKGRRTLRRSFSRRQKVVHGRCKNGTH